MEQISMIYGVPALLQLSRNVILRLLIGQSFGHPTPLCLAIIGATYGRRRLMVPHRSPECLLYQPIACYPARSAASLFGIRSGRLEKKMMTG